MERIINIAIIMLIVCCFYSCDNCSKTKKMENDINKPYLNRQLCFKIFNSGCLEVIDTNNRTIIMSIVDTLMSELNRKKDCNDEYFVNYYSYRQNSSLEEDANFAKDYLEKQFLLYKENDKKCNINYKFIINMYINYIYSIYNNYWFVVPNIMFSEEFYKILEPKKQLLFNHYLYDNAPSNKLHLPLFMPKIYDINDYQYSIRPHYVPFEKAKELLEFIQLNKDEFNTDCLRKEYFLFEKYLNGVVSGKLVLVVEVSN